MLGKWFEFWEWALLWKIIAIVVILLLIIIIIVVATGGKKEEPPKEIKIVESNPASPDKTTGKIVLNFGTKVDEGVTIPAIKAGKSVAM